MQSKGDLQTLSGDTDSDASGGLGKMNSGHVSVDGGASACAQEIPLRQLVGAHRHKLIALVAKFEREILAEHDRFAREAQTTYADGMGADAAVMSCGTKAQSCAYYSEASFERKHSPPPHSEVSFYPGASDAVAEAPGMPPGGARENGSFLANGISSSVYPITEKPPRQHPLGRRASSATLQILNNCPRHLLFGLDEDIAEIYPISGLTSCLFNTSYDFMFKAIMQVAVITNVMVLAFQVGSEWTGWFYVDTAYACIFALELAVKLKETGCWGFLISWDWKWHVFDTMLVVLAFLSLVLEVLEDRVDQTFAFDFQFLRIVRILRLFRLLRLLHLDLFRDLLMMVSGAMGGVRTLGWSIVLITLPVYGFALLLSETAGQKATQKGPMPNSTKGNYDVANEFKTFSKAVLTSFRCLVISDCTSKQGTPIFPLLIEQHGWVYGFLYCLTYVCMSFGFFNVIIAIYVDNTLAAAKANDMVQRHRQMMDDSLFAEHMIQFARYLWGKLHGNNEKFVLRKALTMNLDKDTFDEIQLDAKFHDYLQRLDVPSEDHIDLFDIIDSDGSGVLTLDKMVSGIRRLRGEPRRSDIVFVMLRVGEIMHEVQHINFELSHLNRIRRNDTKMNKDAGTTLGGFTPSYGVDQSTMGLGQISTLDL